MENLDALKIASSKLKSQREKLNITIEEVSAELKLEKEIILSIENNNSISLNLVVSVLCSGHIYKGKLFLFAVKVNESELHERQFESIFTIFSKLKTSYDVIC